MYDFRLSEKKTDIRDYDLVPRGYFHCSKLVVVSSRMPPPPHTQARLRALQLVCLAMLGTSLHFSVWVSVGLRMLLFAYPAQRGRRKNTIQGRNLRTQKWSCGRLQCCARARVHQSTSFFPWSCSCSCACSSTGTGAYTRTGACCVTSTHTKNTSRPACACCKKRARA